MSDVKDNLNDGYLFVKGFSLTAVAAVFLLLRLFAVTEYDWNSAFNLVDVLTIGDAVSMGLGTLMADPILGGIAIALLWPEAIITRFRMGAPAWENVGNLCWLLIVSLFGISLLWSFHMWWVLAVTVAITVVVIGALRLGDENRGHRAAKVAHWYVTGTAVIATILALVFAAVLRVPWAPMERIDTKDGPIIGYVMRVSPGFLDVLVQEGRDMITVDTSDVLKRTEIDEES
ncbi:hypothetical protein [Nocardia camponoti]|uniref:Uncharacterized protein n=1 Tax=Nocardia camponoti TaxID=1616106 RepID=A0A917Q8V0_9NOCA|nr:hypothetical protein [Nocardia camponoti]GGK32927.1 hypothetical protein GCM10011591_00730 [Nocardia camponoti]